MASALAMPALRATSPEAANITGITFDKPSPASAKPATAAAGTRQNSASSTPPTQSRLLTLSSRAPPRRARTGSPPKRPPAMPSEKAA
ncbi:hypothetical protein LMG16407_03168 [Pandoraea apista]|nr:hypothetical protein LMG16407_03168 [Pandoraea apista]